VITQLSTNIEEALVTVKAVSPSYIVYRKVDGVAEEAYCCDNKGELDTLVQQLEMKGGELRVHTNTSEKTIVLPAKRHPELVWYAVATIVLLLILFAMRGC
jgi:hypothetical protein